MGDFWNRSPSDSDSDDNPIYVAKDPRKDKHFDRKQELLWNCKRKAGKVGQGKEPLVIAVIGPPGCGKSSFLNTIFAAFSHDCWTEHAKIGEFGRRDKQVTRRLTSYHTDNGEYLLPTFLDMTGFEDENTPLNKELLRIVFCGKLGEKEELNEVRKFGELYGVNAVKEKYFGENYFGIYKKDSRSSNPIWKFLDFSVILNREEYLRVNRIIVVCSANPDQPLPESLFEAVSDITNRERDITLYGVLTQSDKYKSRDQKVLKREREFMRALGIPKNRFARIKNYCPDIDPNMTYEDTIIPSLDVPVLRLMRQKGTKNELETGRTFATLFSDVYFRLQLLGANTEEEFKKLLEDQTKELADRQRMSHIAHKIPLAINEKPSDTRKCNCRLFQGIKEDLNRRLPHYISDYTDGFTGNKTIQKTISTTLFLYFACLMPSIAFGVLNNENTNGALNVQKVLYSQVFGELFFAVFGGTPQIILLTTAPLALFTKIIYSICEDFSLEFMPMFTCVGLWNSFFLFLYSLFGLSKLMQWSTRSSEEIFALFISIAFIVDALKNTAQNFANHYNIPACNNSSSITTNTSVNVTTTIITVCERDVSLLYLILLLGTLWLGVTLYNFTKTPYLNAGKRELLADYSLPVSVIIMSVFGALAFKDVTMIKSFKAGPLRSDMIQLMPFYSFPVGAVFGAMGLGFCLSLLFFMDQNITAALVNGPQNKMKKGTAYHWDLLVIGVINVVLSLLGFPWVHAALPHSPLHVQALADVEERVDQGHIYKILVSVRETRITAIFSPY